MRANLMTRLSLLEATAPERPRQRIVLRVVYRSEGDERSQWGPAYVYEKVAGYWEREEGSDED